MTNTAFISAQQPDGSVGRRYAKAFRYAFAMLRAGEDLTSLDSGGGPAAGLIDEGRFVVVTMPQELSMRGPFATAVTVMQDGGKVVESRGQVLRPGAISGTTGFLPPRASVPLQATSGRLVPNVSDLDGQLGAVSGYLAFRRLRYLFDLYGDERRRGNLDVAFYFFDYKSDDFWRIEPQTFDVQRTSRRPMSYSFSCNFDCLERADPTASQDASSFGASPISSSNARVNTSNAGGALSKVAGGASAASKSAILSTVSRFADMVTSGLDFLKFCDAVVQRAFQSTLNQLDNVVGFFANVHDTFFTLLNTAPTLMAQLSSSLAGLFSTIHKFAPDNIAQEINAWALEVTVLSDHMAVQIGVLNASQPQRDVVATDQRFSRGRMKQGARTDLMQEPGGGSLDANPFVGASGLSLVTDVDGVANTSQYVTVVISYGEDVYSLARRVLGKIERFVDIVLLNQLEFPFIVADPASKPPNTLAWGESIVVPAATSAPSVVVPAAGRDVSIPAASGTVDLASLPSQLSDSTASWLTNQWVGYSVTVATGALSQTLICNGNTDSVLTLNGNWSVTVTPNVTTYSITYVRFDPRRPADQETQAYGVDLLAVFGPDGRCDAALGPTGDLATVRGLDNLFQAITIRSRTPLGAHPFHRQFGTPAPIGRPFTADVAALYSFFIRRSWLSDPRIERVRNVQVNDVGDTLTLSAELQPVGTRSARSFSVQVGGG